MATRFDTFTKDECNILAACMTVYRDSYWALLFPKGWPLKIGSLERTTNGAAPSRDALLTELQGSTNWPGKHVDVDQAKSNPKRQ